MKNINKEPISKYTLYIAMAEHNLKYAKSKRVKKFISELTNGKGYMIYNINGVQAFFFLMLPIKKYCGYSFTLAFTVGGSVGINNYPSELINAIDFVRRFKN